MLLEKWKSRKVKKFGAFLEKQRRKVKQIIRKAEKSEKWKSRKAEENWKS